MSRSPRSIGHASPEAIATGRVDPRGLARETVVDCRGGNCPGDLDIGFFGIGTAKSRTTWLARCLEQHPDIALSQPKELHFFAPRRYPYDDGVNSRFLSDWSWYAQRFAHAAPDQLRGEFSNTTINHGAITAPLIKSLFPKARFIVCLRDPVTRTYSHYWNTTREQQVRNVPASFEDAVAHGEIVRRSRYDELLRPWFDVFPRGRFLIHFDFEMDRDPYKVVQDTFRFLEVDPTFVPDVVERRVNAPALRSGGLKKAKKAAEQLNAVGLAPFVRLAKRAGVERVLARREKKPAGYPPLSPEDAQVLYHEFAPSIDALEDLLGRDLDPWRRW